jgi:hypothetical protein
VNDVVTKQKWNMQARSVYGSMLKPIDQRRVCHEEHGPELPCPNPLFGDLARTKDEDLTHLANLLVRGHLVQQTIRTFHNSRIT